MFHRKATGELPKFAVRQLEIAAIRYDGFRFRLFWLSRKVMNYKYCQGRWTLGVTR